MWILERVFIFNLITHYSRDLDSEHTIFEDCIECDCIGCDHKGLLKSTILKMINIDIFICCFNVNSSATTVSPYRLPLLQQSTPFTVTVLVATFLFVSFDSDVNLVVEVTLRTGWSAS